MSVRGVCLDAGGVLQLPDSDLVRDALGPLHINPSRERIRAAHYVALAKTERDATSADYDSWIKHYTEALGVPQADLVDTAARLKEAFSDGSAWSEIVPGALDGLMDLDRRGLRVAIISNTLVAGVVARSLARAGICQVGDGPAICVDAILDSSELGFSKPDPRIFQAGLESIGTTAGETVHVGDSASADVRGAIAMGIRAIHYDPMELCVDDTHEHLDDLRRLTDVLD